MRENSCKDDQREERGNIVDIDEKEKLVKGKERHLKKYMRKKVTVKMTEKKRVKVKRDKETIKGNERERDKISIKMIIYY